MSHDYGPLRTYEVTWRSGHIERLQGHQVLFDSSGLASPLAAALGAGPAVPLPPKFRVHGMFGEHWRLVLAADEADLLSLRDVTDEAALTEEAS